MCYLALIGTRLGKSDIQKLIGKNSPLQVRKVENPSVRNAFRGDHTYAITDAYCSCFLIEQNQSPTTEQLREKFRAQYRKKGWPEWKIAGALSDWEASHEGTSQSQADPKNRFFDLLRALAISPRWIALLVHNFSGDFDTEEIIVSGSVKASADALQADGVPLDTLVAIVDPHEIPAHRKLQEQYDALPAVMVLPLLEARQEPWYLDYSDFRSPHDSWLTRLSFTLEGEDQNEDECAKTLEIALLASYHNGTITFTYRNVRTYDLALRRESFPGKFSGRPDWIEDSVVVLDEVIQHRIQWEDKEWVIVAKEIIYEWRKFPSFVFRGPEEVD
jgi:hypothetical protein